MLELNILKLKYKIQRDIGCAENGKNSYSNRFNGWNK